VYDSIFMSVCAEVSNLIVQEVIEAAFKTDE